MVLGLDTIWCYVTDMDRSVAFYRDVLGLSPGHLSPHWSDFGIGDKRLGLHPMSPGQRAPVAEAGTGWILGLEVDDIKAMRAAVESAGGRIHEEYHDIPGGVILSVLDPDGQIIQLTQRGIQASEL